MSASENMGYPDAVRRLRRGLMGVGTGAESPRERDGGSPRSPRSPGGLFFDAIEKVSTCDLTICRKDR